MLFMMVIISVGLYLGTDCTNNVHDLMAEKINQLSREAGTDVVLSK